MSILDIYNNPPNEGRQIRKVGSTVSSYQPYEKNDQASLRNSQLHYESGAPGDYGYSGDGSPVVKLANNRYFAVGERPTDLLSTQNVNDQGHAQTWSNTNQYYTEGQIQDLTTLADLQGATERLQNLER